MTIVVLCNHPDSSYAKDVVAALNTCQKRNIHVITMSPSHNESRDIKRKLFEHKWRFPIFLFQWLKKKIIGKVGLSSSSKTTPNDQHLRELTISQGGDYFLVPHVNGDRCQEVLTALKVDLMLLAGAPIVRAPVLEIPTIGTLNAHQGLLPELRGMNVIEWAILLGKKPSISIHFVNPGVDTGDILASEEVPLQQGDDLQKVKRRASARQPELLAQTAVAVIDKGLTGRPQAESQGRQYFVMHHKIRACAEQVLARRLSRLPSDHK